MDATAAGLLAGVVAVWLVPLLRVSDAVVVAVIVFGVVSGSFLAAALALARRGTRPFHAARLFLGIPDQLPLWWP